MPPNDGLIHIGRTDNDRKGRSSEAANSTGVSKKVQMASRIRSRYKKVESPVPKTDRNRRDRKHCLRNRKIERRVCLKTPRTP